MTERTFRLRESAHEFDTLPAHPSEEELLRLYLRTPQGERDRRFVDTARAAEITGLSRRTIQLWIAIGTIRAIPIGRKYRVDLESVQEFLRRRIEDSA